MSDQTLSIAISKGGLGLAIFQGQHLISLEAHTFTILLKAESSAGHIFKCIERFGPNVAVVQRSTDEPPAIRTAVLEALRACNRPVFEISERDVFTSFGNPPLENKQELRQFIRILFPQIPRGRFVLSCLDAVATGLFFETKRLLNL